MIPAAILALATTGALRVDLWTVGPGDHPYERFGHAALRVRSGDVDLLYNFGAGEFDRAGFLLDFLRGRALFWLDAEDSRAELQLYRYRDRTVYAQPLLLAAERLEWLASRLRDNALPANRNYLYHHFQDNCSTRVRDLIDAASGGKLGNLHYIRTQTTYRRATREGLAGLPGLLLATEFLGRPMDARPDRWERMYLPDALREEVAAAGIAGPIETLYRRRGPSPLGGDTRSGRRTLWICAVVLCGTLYLGARRGGTTARVAMGLAGGLSAAVAIALDVIALLSHQDEFRHNESLLVFWPTDLLLLAGPRPAVRAYVRVRAGLALLLVLWRADGLLVQDNAPLLAIGVALMAALDLGIRVESAAQARAG
jgi:uncharacterized protein DUF4105